MSEIYKGQDKLDLAVKAEQDLNSDSKKHGVEDNGTGFGGKDSHKGASDSTRESGVDESVTAKFPGSTVDTGSSVTGREIPPEQGGDVQRGTGKVTKDTDFDQGRAGQGPEDIAKERALNYGGDNDVADQQRGVKKEKNASGIDQ